VLEKVREEVGELVQAIAAADRAAVEHELGDLLLTVTSLARHLGVSAELALRAASDRFVTRVRRVEVAARARGAALGELGDEERERLWAIAKTAPARGADPARG